MEQWYILRDPATEDGLIDVASIPRFAGIKLVLNWIPYEITIPSFWHLFEMHELGQQIFATGKAHLKQRGMHMKEDTIIDATLVSANNSCETKIDERGLEMHQTRKDNQW